jgi:hypothetical protein
MHYRFGNLSLFDSTVVETEKSKVKELRLLKGFFVYRMTRQSRPFTVRINLFIRVESLQPELLSGPMSYTVQWGLSFFNTCVLGDTCKPQWTLSPRCPSTPIAVPTINFLP